MLVVLCMQSRLDKQKRDNQRRRRRRAAAVRNMNKKRIQAFVARRVAYIQSQDEQRNLPADRRKRLHRECKDNLPKGQNITNNVPGEWNLSKRSGLKHMANIGLKVLPSELGEDAGDGLFMDYECLSVLPDSSSFNRAVDEDKELDDEEAADDDIKYDESRLFYVYGEFKRHLTEQDRREGRYDLST